MREALVHLSVELTEGTLYDPHLAICRYMEGYHAGRPRAGVLQNIEARLKQDEDNVLSEFRGLLAKGMPHPRLGDAFSALGRLHRQGETPWWKEAWRWPAWVIFITTTGWWPMWIEARMAKTNQRPGVQNHLRNPAFAGLCLCHVGPDGFGRGPAFAQPDSRPIHPCGLAFCTGLGHAF